MGGFLFLDRMQLSAQIRHDRRSGVGVRLKESMSSRERGWKE